MKAHINCSLIPYTTKTGIQIGIYYQPPLRRIEHDEEIIQSILLGGQKPKLAAFNSIRFYVCAAVLLIAIAAVVAI